jgi:hypothetical protein
MSLYVASLALPGALKRKLTDRFPPIHTRVFLSHITLAYGVPRSYRVPRTPVQVDVYGQHVNSRTQALMCLINGEAMRPDKKPYHITYSVMDDVPPKEAGLVRADDIAFLPSVADYVSFQLSPHVRKASVSSWTPRDEWRP